MRRPSKRFLLMVVALAVSFGAGAAVKVVQDQCGPFTDVSAMYCPYILEVYFTGISAGTSATTFSPNSPITRAQAAVFSAKTLNQSLARGSRRAALGRWPSVPPWGAWIEGFATTPLPNTPQFGAVASDGTDVWVGDSQGVSRFRASDGRFLESWTTDQPPGAIVIALGRVLVAGLTFSGTASFYVIDPRLPAGAAQKVADIPPYTTSLSFDGGQVWGVNLTGVSIISPGLSGSWQVTNVTSGFQSPAGAVFDGQNIWVADSGTCALLQLNAQGGIQRTVAIGPANCGLNNAVLFDGQNILLSLSPGFDVVRPTDGSIIATIQVGGGVLNGMAFDGERILAFCNGANQSVLPTLSVLRAADYSVLYNIGFSDIGGAPYFYGAASDGVSFWLTVDLPAPVNENVLARF